MQRAVSAPFPEKDLAVPRLYYFNARASVFKIRLFLALERVQYEWLPLEGRELRKTLELSPLAQLPLYQDSCATVSGAANVLIYLGHRHGVAPPPNGPEDTLARGIVLACEELQQDMWRAVASPRAGAPGGAREEFREDVLYPRLTVLSAWVGPQFAVGGRLSYADCALCELFYNVEKEYPGTIEAFEGLQGLRQRLFSLPAATAFLARLDEEERARAEREEREGQDGAPGPAAEGEEAAAPRFRPERGHDTHVVWGDAHGREL